jgi:ABC-type bacteriocin/lantibiotic exporter with double-glycine peptidase domain
MNLVKDIADAFPIKAKIYFFLMLFLFLVTMFLETVTIAFFLPIVTLILNKDISENLLYQKFQDYFNLDLNYLMPDYSTFFLYFFLIFFTKTILVLFCKFQILKFSKNCNIFLVTSLFKKYISLSFSRFISKNSSEFLKNLTHEVAEFAAALYQTLELFSELIVILGILTFLLFFDLQISLISGVSIFLIAFLFNFFTKKKLFEINNKIRLLEKQRLKNYIESFNLIKEIKLFNTEKHFIDKNYEITESFWKKDVHQKFIRLIPKPTIEMLLLMVIILLVSKSLQAKGTVYTLEFLTVFLAATYRVVPSLFRIISSLQNIRSCLPSVKNLVTDLKKEEQNHEIGRSNFKGINKKISIENMTFKYQESHQSIFEKKNFIFEYGKITGVNGRTGSGKTTLINLICGLLKPSEGKIKYDDISTDEMNTQSLRNKIGYVPQNIYLLDESINENILFGNKKNDGEKMQKIISICELDKFISNLPKGINTVVGEKSSKISGGQTQRIGIARALYKDPSILILDEATNALDKKTAEKIIQNIKKAKDLMTIIIITHDKNILDMCDNKIDLNLEI